MTLRTTLAEFNDVIVISTNNFPLKANYDQTHKRSLLLHAMRHLQSCNKDVLNSQFCLRCDGSLLHYWSKQWLLILLDLAASYNITANLNKMIIHVRARRHRQSHHWLWSRFAVTHVGSTILKNPTKNVHYPISCVRLLFRKF